MQENEREKDDTGQLANEEESTDARRRLKPTSRLVDHHSFPQNPSTDDQRLENRIDDEVGSQRDDAHGESAELELIPLVFLVEGRVHRRVDTEGSSSELNGRGETRIVLGGSGSSGTHLEEDRSCSEAISKEEDSHDDW